MKIHKIAKSDNSNLILLRINIKIIIYLDNIILIGHSLEETVMSRDKVIFLLQRLGFVINWKKFVLTSVQEIEFLGLKINSITLELSLNKTKIQKSSSRMSEFVKQSTNINSGVDKVDWFVDINYSSSFTSKVELPFPSNTTNIIFIRKPFLFGQTKLF